MGLDSGLKGSPQVVTEVVWELGTVAGRGAEFIKYSLLSRVQWFGVRGKVVVHHPIMAGRCAGNRTTATPRLANQKSPIGLSQVLAKMHSWCSGLERVW